MHFDTLEDLAFSLKISIYSTLHNEYLLPITSFLFLMRKLNP